MKSGSCRNGRDFGESARDQCAAKVKEYTVIGVVSETIQPDVV